MNTYREVVAMVQDLLKNESDDRYYTDDHIVYLFNKYRALFLFQYYKNKPLSAIPDSNKQTICVELERDFNKQDNKLIIQSKEKLPDLIDIDDTLNASIPDNPYNFRLTYVSPERFPFTNSIGYLSKIIYMTRVNSGKLQLSAHSSVDSNYLKRIELKGIFDDPNVASRLSCNIDHSVTDELDFNVFLEAKLINLVIKTIVQDLSYGLYRPKDNMNNAKDDLSNSSVDNYLRSQRSTRRRNDGYNDYDEDEE